MYDDASYYYSSYNSQSQSQSQSSQRPKHHRKQSLLEPSLKPEGLRSHDNLDNSVLSSVQEPIDTGPPQATVKRRAQSYTDFHYAVQSFLRGAPPSRVERKGTTPSTSSKSFAALDLSSEALDNPSLQDDVQFTDWYHDIEKPLVEACHEEFLDYQQRLMLKENHMDSLLQETAATLTLLDELAGEFKTVQSQTTAFQRQCEGLISEQRRMDRLADELNDNLKYYSYLEPATRRLNAPGAGSLVKSQEFSEMLVRIDQCLAYMARHPKHKESLTYQARYRLLMTRGLTLVRANFVGGLRDIASDVSKRIADKQLNDTTMSALLYAKFRVGAAEYKEVAQEIRKRAVPPSDAEPGQEGEYQSLMNELYTSYSATRGKLVIPLARKKMAEIALAPSTSKDLVSFARSAIGYTRGVCSDEYDLWRNWFVGEEGMYDFLESVCDPLYDHLRPRIIHETHLLKLCELCTLLQTRYMNDQDDETDVPEVNQVDFSILVQPALEDAQTRLVFRAQSILRDEIERYKPSKEELDYPTRNRRVPTSGTKSKAPALSGRKGSAPAGEQAPDPAPKAPTIVEEDDAPNGYKWNLDSEAALEGWYPTLRKAIWLLSRIYRLVHSTVFDDLAHNIVHTTTNSLINASRSISSLPHRTASDGRLFLIKHLLILKSQIVAFDIEYVSADISFDFSNLTNTFAELQRERGGLFDPRNWLRLVRGGLLPQVVENMFDAKAELDGQLRSVINEFTSSYASTITAPINTSAVASPRFDPLAAVAKVKEIASTKEIPLLRRKVDEYIDDFYTRETLVAACQELAVQSYETFYDDYSAKQHAKSTSGGAGPGAGKSKKGKGRDDEVWDMDMFTEWASDTFDVKGIEGFGRSSGMVAGDGASSYTSSRRQRRISGSTTATRQHYTHRPRQASRSSTIAGNTNVASSYAGSLR